MTASKERNESVEREAAQARNSLVKNSLHSSETNIDAVGCHSEVRLHNMQEIKEAKDRFFSIVSSGVADLVNRYGYSQERATGLVLRQIRWDDNPPDDNEVFNLMKKRRISRTDATIALTVARAVHRVRTKCSHLSAAEAVEELSAKVNAKMVIEERSKCLIRGVVEEEYCTKRIAFSSTTSNLIEGLGSKAIVNNNNPSKSICLRSSKNLQDKVAICNLRKRSAGGDDFTSNCIGRQPTMSGNSDTVVDKRITKKSKIVDDTNSMGKESRILRSLSPVNGSLRSKRSASQVLEEEGTPKLKRARISTTSCNSSDTADEKSV